MDENSNVEAQATGVPDTSATAAIATSNDSLQHELIEVRDAKSDPISRDASIEVVEMEESETNESNTPVITMDHATIEESTSDFPSVSPHLEQDINMEPYTPQEVSPSEATPVIATNMEEQPTATSESSFVASFMADPLVTENEEYASVAEFYNIPIDQLKNDVSLYNALSARMSEIEFVKQRNANLEDNYETLKGESNEKLKLLNQKLEDNINTKESLEEKVKLITLKNEEFEKTLLSLRTSKNDENRTIANLTVNMKALSDEKSNAFQLLEAKQIEIVNLTEEINSFANQTKELRKKIFEVETIAETSKADLWKAKTDSSKFEREIKSLKESLHWFESALKDKTIEFENLRSESDKQIISLQSKFEKVNQDYIIANSNSSNNFKALKEFSLKNEKASFEIKELKDKIAIQESQYLEKLTKSTEYIQVLEKNLKNKTNRIDSLEKLYEETLENIKQDEFEYKKQNNDLYKEVATKTLKIQELEDMVSDLSNSGTLNSSGEQISLTPVSQKTLKEMNSQYSLSDLIGEINTLRKEVIKERRAKNRAEDELKSVFDELDQRMPLLQSYKDKCDQFEEKEKKMAVVLDNVTKENSNLQKKFTISTKKTSEYQNQLRSLSKYKIDLQRQVVVLLSQLQFKANGETPLTQTEKDKIYQIVAAYGEVTNTDTTDTDELITERLSTFKNVIDLVKTNEELLITVRKLGEKLENNETNGQLEVENDSIRKATEAINKLKFQLNSSEIQLQAACRARDTLQEMIDSGVSSANDADLAALNQRIILLVDELQKKKDEINSLREKYDEKLGELNEKYQSVVAERADLKLELAKEKSNGEILHQKHSSIETTMNLLQSEKDQLLSIHSKLQDRMKYLEEKLQIANDSLIKNNSTMAQLEISLKGLSVEKEIWKNNESQLRSDIEKLHEEKVQANNLIIKLETTNTERQIHFKETVQRFNNNVEILQKEADQLRFKLDKSYNDTHSVLHSKNADAKAYQNRIDLLQDEVKLIKDSLVTKNKVVDDLTLKLNELTKKYGDGSDKKQNRLNVISGTTYSSDDISTLKTELAEAIEDLEIANKDATQYKELSIATENQLVALNDTFEQYKLQAEERIKSNIEEISNFKLKVSNLEKERNEFKNEFENIKLESSIKEQDYEVKIVELNSVISDFETVKNEYEEKLDIVTSDADSKSEKIGELQQQITANGEQLDLLESQKVEVVKELNEVKESLANIANELSQSKSTIKANSDLWEAERAKYEEDMRMSKIRISELDTQNRTLVNQLEESPLTFGESDEMKHLVTYLTREKDSLTQQLNYARGEEKILRQDLSNKEQQLLSLKAELETTKEKVAILDKYSDKLEEMKLKVQEIQVYKDNNAHLREQVEQSENKINELKNQLVASESNLEPLQNEIKRLQGEIELRDRHLSLGGHELENLREKHKNLEMAKETSDAASVEIKKELEMNLTEVNELKSKLERMRKEFIEKLRNKKGEVTVLEQANISLRKKIEELQLSNGESSGDSSEEVKKLKLQMRELKNQIFEKDTEKNKLIASHENELESLAEKLKEINSRKSGPDSAVIADLKIKYEKEKEEALKALEIKLSSSITEKNRKDIDAQWQKKLNEEIDQLKKQQLSKISKLLDKRKAELTNEYNAKYSELNSKIKSLEKQLADAQKPSSESTTDVNGTLISKFEAEKNEIIEKAKQEKEKILKEKKMRETLFQKRLETLEKKNKDLEEKVGSSKDKPTATTGFNFSSAAKTASAFQPMTTSFNATPVMASSLNPFGNKSLTSSAQSSNTPTPSPFTFGKDSGKRASDEGEESEEKRSKLN
ncbi:Mlp1 protein [Martiniozyma asiatica (nom. inval.)]|nr:Mlp1 protein [Martiniozyma asiatica]